jgi:hypothetical protein
MNINNRIMYLALGFNFLNIGFGGIYVMNRQQHSLAANSERDKKLETVSRHLKSDTCLVVPRNGNFRTPTIGEEINLENPQGKSSSSCIQDKTSNSILFVAYENNVLKVQDVFSQKEVKAKLSQIKGTK